MILTLLLLGACNAAPLFDLSGPSCVAAAQAVECECSEGMTWAPSSGAAYYKIMRTTASSGFRTEVGRTSRTTWWFALDVPFPHEGVLYHYNVVACNATDACAGDGPTLDYVGAPYACYDATGREVQCYAGDPVLKP